MNEKSFNELVNNQEKAVMLVLFFKEEGNRLIPNILVNPFVEKNKAIRSIIITVLKKWLKKYDNL